MSRTVNWALIFNQTFQTQSKLEGFAFRHLVLSRPPNSLGRRPSPASVCFAEWHDPPPPTEVSTLSATFSCLAVLHRQEPGEPETNAGLPSGAWQKRMSLVHASPWVPLPRHDELWAGLWRRGLGSDPHATTAHAWQGTRTHCLLMSAAAAAAALRAPSFSESINKWKCNY